MTVTRTSTSAPALTSTRTDTPTITPTSTITLTLTAGPSRTATPTLALPSGPLTIDYTYDELNRLTAADYSDDRYYHYQYDAVGNRLSAIELHDATAYGYDDANRLTGVDGISQTWDPNGNLLDDGVNTYTYDPANRLTSIVNPQSTIENRYNGLGDRLQQTVGASTTTYAMDFNAGLTQVLNDGTNDYLYGDGRIAQVNTTTQYFLGDALGSVRQVARADGNIVLAKAYDPYGNPTVSVGTAQSVYGFDAEQTDSNGLIYLRSRMYSPSMGRFMTRDTWGGNTNLPMTFNRWNYTNGNPINFVDPSGHSPLPCIGCGPDVTDWYTEELRIWQNNSLGLNMNLHDMCPLLQTFPVDLLAVLANGGEFPYKVIDFNYADEPNREGDWPNPTVNEARSKLPFHGQAYANILNGINDPPFDSPFNIQGGKVANTATELTWHVPGGGSVTLCGTCIERSELGNFMLGYYAGNLELADEVALHGGKLIGGFTRTWDEAAYHLGYKYAEEQISNPFSSLSLCDFLKQQGITQMVDRFVEEYTPSPKALYSGFGHYTSFQSWDASWGAPRKVNNANASPGTAITRSIKDNNPWWSHWKVDDKNLMINRDLSCRYDPTNC